MSLRESYTAEQFKKLRVRKVKQAKVSREKGIERSKAYQQYFIAQCTKLGMPVPSTEFKLARNPMGKKKFLVDFYWPDANLLIEVEGGVRRGVNTKTGGFRYFGMGRHQRPEGYVRDIYKYNLAISFGYVLLRYTPFMLKDEYCIQEVYYNYRRLLAQKNVQGPQQSREKQVDTKSAKTKLVPRAPRTISGIPHPSLAIEMRRKGNRAESGVDDAHQFE